MNTNSFVDELYQAVDDQDVKKLTGYLTEDSLFQFANIPGVQGKQNISDFLTSFNQTIKSISHTELESWFKDGVSFVTGKVTYVRPDDFTLTVPFGVLLKFKGDLIKEWLVFVDNSELFK